MKKKLTSFLLCLLFFLLLFFPEAVQAGAKEGLYLWYSTMIPILFPFILISNLLLATDSVRYFTYPFLPILKWFPSLNPYFPYALIFGWFCGYPMGAKTVADLLKSGKITEKEGDFILPAANQASPMFLMGYLGIHIFKKSYSFGQILFFVYFPVIIYFLFGLFLFSFQKGQKNIRSRSNASFYMDTGIQSSFSLEDTILSSFQIIVNIGVYMMIFTIFMRLALLLLPGGRVLPLLTGFLEMSTGISWLSGLTSLPVLLRDCLILSVAAFGGLCTCAQTLSVIKGQKLSMTSYVIRKLFLGGSTFLVAYFFL